MPELNSAVVILSWWKIRVRFTVWRLIFFSGKILSEGPYLKSFISRELCLYRERFCSLRASVICLPVATYNFLSLQCDNSTMAVNLVSVYWLARRPPFSIQRIVCTILYYFVFWTGIFAQFYSVWMAENLNFPPIRCTTT